MQFYFILKLKTKIKFIVHYIYLGPLYAFVNAVVIVEPVGGYVAVLYDGKNICSHLDPYDLLRHKQTANLGPKL